MHPALREYYKILGLGVGWELNNTGVALVLSLVLLLCTWMISGAIHDAAEASPACAAAPTPQ